MIACKVSQIHTAEVRSSAIINDDKEHFKYRLHDIAVMIQISRGSDPLV